MRKLNTMKSTFKEWCSKNSTKVCGSLMAISGSLMAMSIPASAAEYSYNMTTVADDIFGLGTKALDFCLANQAMATIFTVSVVGMIFGVVKKAKRSVK